MAKFIAKGTVSVKEKFEVEIEASSKIAARQQLLEKTAAEDATLLDVEFTEISEETESEEKVIVDCLPETEATDPKEDFADEVPSDVELVNESDVAEAVTEVVGSDVEKEEE